MNTVAVTQYSNPRAYLLDVLSTRQKSEPGFSVRQWAQEMGLKSHSLLVLLLQGKRPIRLSHVNFLAPSLKLSSAERLYFQAMIQLANASSDEEKRLCELWLSELNPGSDFRVKEIDQYAVIAHWIHTTILTLTKLPSFKGTPEEICEKLQGRVSIHEARSAVLRLLELGLAKKDESGRLVATNSVVTTRDDVSMKAVREHLKQVTDLARNAIDQQDILEREFQAFSVPVRTDQIPLVKEMMRRFRTQVSQALSADQAEKPANEVYQMNLQFFRLTERPANHKISLEDEGTAKSITHSIRGDKNVPTSH